MKLRFDHGDFSTLHGSALLAVLAALVFVPIFYSQETAAKNGIDHRADVSVPMRDGVVLRADVLLPSAEGKFPALLYRTPYGKQFALREYKMFEKAVARGYAVVVQDVRGRYASDGEFVAYQNEGRDGYDTIEWVANQSWCDGNVGTFGLSYPGAVQWLAAVENPPHLKAMAPAMTFSTPRNFYYSGGVFDGSWLDWIWMNIAPDIRRRKNLAGPKTYQEAAESWKREHERLQNFLPLHDLPDLKNVAPFYYEWLSHSPADPWWDWAELHNKYGRVQAAVLNLSGWYDEAYGPDGATTNFNGLLASRKGDTNSRTRTLIGPWTHGGQEKTRAGEREFGPSAAIDYDELILRWMDRYVRGVENGVDREKPVRIFVMGKNVWRDEDAWPLARAKAQTYYLRSETNSARFARLNQTAPDRAGSYNEFVSDPTHPVTDPYDAYGAHDYRSLAGRSDVLVYDTDLLPSDTEVTGPIHAEIYVSADTPDFDLWVRLLDIAPDGTAFNLMSPGLDVLRASYRNEKLEPELLKGSEIYKLTLDRMLTSNVFRSGHQIRIQISGAFFPHFSRNLQSGESELTSSRMCPAHVRIYHDPDHRSRIELPVIPR
jgi:putative CocE/NonD family hydrolase